MVSIKKFPVLLLLIVPFLLHGQNDALIHQLKTKIETATDKENFLLLNDLAWEYRFAYPDSTIFFSTRALELGKALFIEKGLSRSLNYIGVAYDKKGEPINAYDAYLKAYILAEEQHDTIQIAYTNNNIGRLLANQGLHGRALEYFLKAKKVFEKLNDPSGLAYVLQSIGRVHEVHKDFAKGVDNFQQAYALRVKVGNTRDIMAALVLLGIAYQNQNDIDRALVYFNQADSVGKMINDKINMAEIKIHLAKNYLAKGLLDSAQILSESGLQTIEAQKLMRTLPEALMVRGEVMHALGKRKEARELYSKALEITGHTKELDYMMKAHYLLWKLAESSGLKSESIEHQNIFLVIQDSLTDLEVTRKLERYQFEIDIQKKDLENQLIKAQDAAIIQASRWQNVILSIVTFFTLLTTYFYRRNSRQAKKSNELLVAQNHQLNELNHEKDTLMNIVAHDLKSPLNRINGLVTLLEMDKEPESQTQYLKFIKDVTKSGLTLIGDLLLVSAASEPNHKTEVQKIALNKLVEDSIEAFKETASAKDIVLVKLNSEVVIVTSDPLFIARILENLISNAIKFSKPNSDVMVNYGHSPKDFFVSVKDTGPGFSEVDKAQMYQKFKRLSARPTANETSNGLGLALIKYSVERLGGKIELISEERKGSEFSITIPLQ